MIATTTTHLHVAESTPQYHCSHDDGEISITVARYPTDVYLTGTRANIAAWAAKVIGATSEESG